MMLRERGWQLPVWRSWLFCLSVPSEHSPRGPDPHLSRTLSMLSKRVGRDAPSPGLTSCSHCSSPSLTFPPLPYRLTHSCVSSSHSSFSRFLWLIPLALANLSHLVSGFGLGSGFSRGKGVVGGKGWMRGPRAEGWVGRVRRVVSSDWVEVRVRARRWGLRLVLYDCQLR
jgi:hypothetical protein